MNTSTLPRKRGPCRCGALQVALPLSVVIGCSSPVTPTAPTTGVIVYENGNFKGNDLHIYEDIADLSEKAGGCHQYTDQNGQRYPGHWGDCISSIRVLPGWRVTVYQHDEFRGASVTFTADVVDLERISGPNDGHFGDCISSIRVARSE